MGGRVSNVCKIFFAAACLSVAARAEVAWRTPVSFTAVSNTGIGRSLYVVGNQPELGNWQPTGAVRLSVAAGTNWSGQVAIRSGASVEYKFISRVDSSGQHCENTNVVWTGGANLTSSVPAHPVAPYAGKTMYYHSSWTSAFLLFSTDGTNFSSTNMTQVGAGRTGGEYLYRVSGFGVAGAPVQFVPSGFLGGTQFYDNAPYPGYGSGDYYTPLDVFFLQGGQIFNYWPPAAPSASQIVTTFVGSSFGSIPARNVRVYLPRGYTNSAWRRYPVLYMHDGQNVFAPGGAFGCWGVESTMDREISQGRVRETIVVGVLDVGNRLSEYCPPGDTAAGNPGNAKEYANFLIHNVRPHVDAAFRTLNDPGNTLTIGSSMGGLVSAYLGLETNVFGKVGPMSPSFWTASNFVGRIATNALPLVRFYMDWGTGNEASSMWNPCWGVVAALDRNGYSRGQDLLPVVGCGQDHNEAAWSNRFPVAARFLLSPWDEPNRLAQEEHPPRVGWSGATGVVHRSLAGFRYRLEQASDPGGAWASVQTSAVEALPWSSVEFGASGGAEIRLFRSVAEMP